MARWITCPQCGAVSYHPKDVEEGYCGRCHDWTDGVRSFHVPGMGGAVATTPGVPTPQVMWQVARLMRKHQEEGEGDA